VSSRQRFLWTVVYVTVFLAGMVGLALADPLDDAGAKLGTFLQRAGLIMTGLIPAAGALAIGGLAVKRSVSKTLGEEEGMNRTSNHIVEVIKLTMVGTAASLIVGIAGSILK